MLHTDKRRYAIVPLTVYKRTTDFSTYNYIVADLENETRGANESASNSIGSNLALQRSKCTWFIGSRPPSFRLSVSAVSVELRPFEGIARRLGREYRAGRQQLGDYEGKPPY